MPILSPVRHVARQCLMVWSLSTRSNSLGTELVTISSSAPFSERLRTVQSVLVPRWRVEILAPLEPSGVLFSGALDRWASCKNALSNYPELKVGFGAVSVEEKNGQTGATFSTMRRAADMNWRCTCRGAQAHTES